MKSITEAILNRKQSTGDLLSSPEEQLNLFNQAFRKVRSGYTYSNDGIISYFKGIHKDQLSITIDSKYLSHTSNMDGINTNFFELDAESWPFTKNISFENIKLPITIILKGSNIDGFKFTGKKGKRIVFYIYEDQKLSNCDFSGFSGIGMQGVICILKKGTDYFKEKIGNIYNHLLSPCDIVDAKFNPISSEKWNTFDKVIGDHNKFTDCVLHTKIKIDAKENPVDNSHDPDIQERKNNREGIIKRLKQYGGFFVVNLNQETI